jgi:hypothetical protein
LLSEILVRLAETGLDFDLIDACPLVGSFRHPAIARISCLHMGDNYVGVVVLHGCD